MRVQTTAARPEKRNLFMQAPTRGLDESCDVEQAFRPPVVSPVNGLTAPAQPGRADARATSAALPLAGLLHRIHGHRDVQIQRRADDPVLLDGVGGRVALARRGAL